MQKYLKEMAQRGQEGGDAVTITSKKLTSHPDRSETRIFEHFVQFYETDAFLLEIVSDFIRAGLQTGDVCIVIATKLHQEGLAEQLKATGLDITDVQARGVYLCLDAEETLRKLSVDGWPDAERLTQIIGSCIVQAAKGRHHVRVFGEMVALLWSEGKQDAAIHLEALWNDLSYAIPSFSLLCAYPIQSFAGVKHAGSFSQICQQHAQVLPDENYAHLSNPNEHFRTIALLQQQAHSLPAEIAGRKALEKALLHSAAIIEFSDDAILSKDLDGVVTSWNAAAERMYGYSAQEIVGQPVSLLFPPDRQDEFLKIMTRIRQGERVHSYETRRVRKDGTPLTVSVTISPVKDSGGTIIGASAIARDITEHKQLEARCRQLFDSNLIGVFVSDFAGTFLEANNAFLDLLGYTRAELQARTILRDALTPPEWHFLSQQAIQALQEAGVSGTYEKEYLHKNGRRVPVLVAVTRIGYTNTCIGCVLDISERRELEKRKDEFIGIASHELKTPVTSLKGFLGLLQRLSTTQGDEKMSYYLTRMDAQITRLTKLINDLLDLSKMQAGQLLYREERIEIDTLVQEVIEMIEGATQTHRLLLEGRTRALVVGDYDRIGQALTNLINNAIKYSPEADKILVRLAKDHSSIQVSVHDFGIGIDDEDQRKIFERFYQVAGAEEKNSSGLGIGLYITHDIVKQHGGRLWVESKKGEGSVFYITLPLAEAKEREAL